MFPGKTAPVQHCRRRLSFTDEIIIFDAEDTPEDPQSVPPLILPVVVEETEVIISETGVPPLTLLSVEYPKAEHIRRYRQVQIHKAKGIHVHLYRTILIV